MYRTVYYCLTIHLTAVYGFNGLDCTESEIIVSEELCDYKNGSQTSIQIFNEDILHSRNLTQTTLSNQGCKLNFDTVDFANEFYVECETEIDCPDEDEDVTIKTMNTFFFECENMTLVEDNSTSNITEFVSKDSIHVADASIEDDDRPFDKRKLAIITGSVAAGLATVAGVAAALYKMQTILQSGKYLFPNTPAPTGFSEMP